MSIPDSGTEPRSRVPEGSRTMGSMAVVSVRGPLRKLTGGSTEHELEGETVIELLRGLESRHPAAGEWEQADGVALPEGGEKALERIWVITSGEADGLLYAGGDPGVLFESHDGGVTWELNRGLWDHPTHTEWQPGGGGLCLHSIATWP